jgi:probable HAF family extracellular repeat protein
MALPSRFLTSECRAALAVGINDQGQIVGQVVSADGTTVYGALWQNLEITNLRTLPGDFTSFAEGINNQGQVVGSTQLSNGDWSHAFIWQNGVMTRPEHVVPCKFQPLRNHGERDQRARTNRGHGNRTQRAGCGQDPRLSGNPRRRKHRHVGCRVARTHPKITLPANVGKQLLQRFGR